MLVAPWLCVRAHWLRAALFCVRRVGWAVSALVFQWADGTRTGFAYTNSMEPLPLHSGPGGIEAAGGGPTQSASIAAGEFVTSVSGLNSRSSYPGQRVTLHFSTGRTVTIEGVHRAWDDSSFSATVPAGHTLRRLFFDKGTFVGFGLADASHNTLDLLLSDVASPLPPCVSGSVAAIEAFEPVRPLATLNPTETARSYSSVHNNDPVGTGHHRSKLDSPQGWSTIGSSPSGQWMTIDLGAVTSIVGVITQGRANSNQWVTAYSVSTSTDGTTFTPVPGASSLTGNTDHSTPVSNLFGAPVLARHVRITPLAMNAWTSMRAAVLQGETVPSAAAALSSSCLLGAESSGVITSPSSGGLTAAAIWRKPLVHITAKESSAVVFSIRDTLNAHASTSVALVADTAQPGYNVCPIT